MNQLMIDAISIAQIAFGSDVERPEYIMSGETKLMEFDELSNVETLKQLFNAFSQQQEILRLLDRSIAAQGVQIFIGEESGAVTKIKAINKSTAGINGQARKPCR